MTKPSDFYELIDGQLDQLEFLIEDFRQASKKGEYMDKLPWKAEAISAVAEALVQSCAAFLSPAR